MNEPTISARSVSLPRRSLCQWVDTVTVETPGRVSVKISLRKWKCLRWLELGPPPSWSHVRMEAGVVVMLVGADLGWLGLGESHTWPRQAMLLGQKTFSVCRAGAG